MIRVLNFELLKGTLFHLEILNNTEKSERFGCRRRRHRGAAF